MTGDRTRKLTAVLLAALFTFGVGTEAYGWHDCPHHHPDHDAAPAAGGAPAHPVAADGGETEGAPAGPCICVGSCHAGATVPLPAATAPTLAGEGAIPPRAAPVTSSLLPRIPDPYFLPFANAPPVPGLRAPGA